MIKRMTKVSGSRPGLENTFNRNSVRHCERPIRGLTEREVLAAEMFQSAYIQDRAQLRDFVENTSEIGRKGYFLDEQLSNNLVKVFHRDGRAVVAFRGTQTGLLAGQLPTLDDVNNANNLLGTARFRNQQVDLINRTMRRVLTEYGPPDFYTGHSRGGAEVKIAKLAFGGGEGFVFNSAPSVAASLLASKRYA